MTGGESLDDEEPIAAVAGAYGSGLIQQRAGPRTWRTSGFGVAEAVTARGAEPVEDAGELASAGPVDALEEPGNGVRRAG